MLDLNRDRLNTEMVDPFGLTDDDVARITQLLELHVAETGSTVAQGLLEAGPDAWRGRFTRVLPRDYARVIAARADAEASGLSEEETVEKMMEAAHG